MEVALQKIQLTKRFALAISRGVSTGSQNVFVTVRHGDLEGYGECAPGVGYDDSIADAAIEQLSEFATGLSETSSVREIHARAIEQGIDAASLAGLDMALWDLLAKQAGLPLYRLLGFGKPTAPTSITAGLNAPEVTREQVAIMLRETGCKALKVKLGSPDGIEHDKSHFEAARESAKPFGVTLRVDANCGWSLPDAKHMMTWLKDRDVDYIEQPLGQHAFDEWAELYKTRCLPLFADESCQHASDIAKLHDRVDGVNLKLMKCGGITGALRIIETAQAFGLQLMIGCMGESSVSISAGAAISGAMTHIDLDSHLNLAPDPAKGACLVDGIVMPPEVPGHGARLRP